jgi:hypothetical protein
MVDGPLVKPAHHFSKFIHGTAVLLPKLVKTVPSWMDEFMVEDKMEIKAIEPGQDGQEDDLQFNDIWMSEHTDEHSLLVDDEESSQSLDRSHLESSSRENVRRVLSGRHTKKGPTIWKRLQNLFDFDQRFVKDGKPIMSKQMIVLCEIG